MLNFKLSGSEANDWNRFFAGAGGMSLGTSAAGVKIIVAVEVNKHAAETYKANHSTSSLNY